MKDELLDQIVGSIDSDFNMTCAKCADPEDGKHQIYRDDIMAALFCSKCGVALYNYDAE